MSSRLRLVTALLAVTTVLGACSSGGSDAADGGSADATGTTNGPNSADCAWPVKADEDTLNVAYPDTNATYWATPFDLGAGERLRIQGRFPQARYFSFITYESDGNTVDVLTDSETQVDPGEGDVSYTVDVRTDGVDELNSLDAAPEPLADGAGGEASGTVILRVYLPQPADDATGGAGLPDVAVIDADGTSTPIETCAEPGASKEVEERVAAEGPATDRQAPPQPVFIRPDSVANLYPNPDNIYVATILAHEPGRIVVIRGQAPTVPEQMRYWSLCTNEYRKPYPVTACVADEDVAVGPTGSYTFVISTEEDRPENATAENGVTWVDWGSTEVDNLVLMRQMLPVQTFEEAAGNLEPGELASTVMGPYTPVGVYCTTEAFAEGGAKACPAP